MEGIGLYPEGTREPPEGFKRGDVRAICFRRILLAALWEMSQRGKTGVKWSSEGLLV